MAAPITLGFSTSLTDVTVGTAASNRRAVDIELF